MNHFRAHALLWLLAMFLSQRASAAWYGSPNVRWSVMATRPLAQEPTPNYYGYGIGVSGGYSLRQIADLGVFTTYIPGRHESARLDTPQVEVKVLGMEGALRLARVIYLGARFGQLHFQRVSSQGAKAQDLSGRWSGPVAGIAFGGIHKIDRENFLQTSLELMHTRMENPLFEGEKTRDLDIFALSVAYTFNQFENSLSNGSSFGNFIELLNF